MPNELNIINIPNIGGYKIALDKESKSLYAAQITSNNYLSGITSSDFFRISQQIFSIPSFDSVQPSGTGIYIDNNGQSKFYDGTDFVDISYEIVSQISVDTIKNDDTVPTTRAVSAFVEKSVPSSIQLSGTIVGTAVFNGSDIRINTSLGDGFSIDASKVQGLTISWNDIQNKPTNIPLSGDVTGTANLVTNTITTTIAGLPWSKIIDPPTIPSINGLATETYVDSKVSGKLNISEFNTFKNNNTNVITSAKTEAITSAKTYTDTMVSGKLDKSVMIPNINAGSANDSTIPTTKAVYDFVNSKEVTPEVFYVETFPTNVTVSGLYINYDGETRFYDNLGNYEQVSYEMVTSINVSSTDNTVPTTKAVYTFVTEKILEVETGSSDISEQLSGKADVSYVDEQDKKTLNAANAYTDSAVSSKINTSAIKQVIDSTANDSTIPTTKAVSSYVAATINNKSEVEILNSFPATGKTDTIYVNSNSNEAKYYNSGWQNLSIKAIRNMTGNETDDVVPTTQAVAKFLEPKLAAKSEISISNQLPTTGQDNILYISENGQTAVNINGELTNISVDVIDDIVLTGNDKNIPTSVAVSAFIDYKLNGESYVDNTNSIIELTPESNVSYKFNIPATALTINIVQNITNTVIQFETGLSCTYAFSIPDTYKINKQFALEDNKSYIIIIDNGLIVWSQIENYQGE